MNTIDKAMRVNVTACLAGKLSQELTYDLLVALSSLKESVEDRRG